jgi:hypothetical protein
MEDIVAESANPPNAPAVPPPPPVVAAPVPVTAPPVRRSGTLMKSIARLLTTTTFLILGLGFIILGIIVRLWPSWLPGFLKPALDQLFPRLPYFVVGIGLFFLGWARSMAAQQLISEYRKNRKFPHAWKIPLISVQAFLLEMACFIYALPVGLGWYPPLQNLMAMVWVVFFFLLYTLWYVTAHFLNRIPAIAGLRMAIVTVALSAVSDILWWFQSLFPAVLLGILGVISLLIASLIRVKGVEQTGSWPKITLLAVSVVFLTHLTYNALPFGNPTADLMNLTLATKSLQGEIQNINYFSAPDHSKDEIVFSQKTDEGFFLDVITAVFSQQEPLKPYVASFKVPAGDEVFRSIFVKNGTLILADMALNGSRSFWKVDVKNGKASLLCRNIQPIEDGIPWSESRGQFLYVTQADGKYRLNILTLASGKSKILMTSENPIHTPSWVPPLNPQHNAKGFYPEQQVAYADGIHGLFYVVDVKTGDKEPLMSEAERSLEGKFVPEGKTVEAIPAPDGFRYLYLAEKNKTTEFWLVLADGTKREMIYQTNASVSNLAWHPDGQQIVFEEIHAGLDHGFFKTVSTAKLLDANLGNCVNLLPPQISTRSPAVASDGVKVAFVAGEGLWYPAVGQGIWVAALR